MSEDTDQVIPGQIYGQDCSLVLRAAENLRWVAPYVEDAKAALRCNASASYHLALDEAAYHLEEARRWGPRP